MNGFPESLRNFTYLCWEIPTDGVGNLDIHILIETHDGALISAVYTGVVDCGEDGYTKFLRGELPASGTPIRMVMRGQTAHPTYQWLNRLQCMGIGQAFFDRFEFRYNVYAMMEALRINRTKIHAAGRAKRGCHKHRA